VAGLVIDSIEIDNRNIYDLTDERYRNLLFRAANRLHLVTRDWVVRRELLFAVGEPFSPELADETARNLRTRLPFNDAWIEVQELAPGRLLVRVVTVDQWSLIGGLRSIHRDGNETDLRLGFEERNFLGRAQFFSFDYFWQEKHPDFVQVAFRESRVMGQRYSVSLDYRSDPYYTIKSLSAGRPFYELAQRLTFGLAVQDELIRERRFDDEGNLAAQWMNSGDELQLSAGFRFGPANRKVSLESEYKYYSSRVRDLYLDTSSATVELLPVDSSYHRFLVGSTYRLQSFIVEQRISGFGYHEDMTLGLRVSLAGGRAFRPDFKRHYYDLLLGGLAWSKKLGNNILRVEYGRAFWLKHAQELRHTSDLTVVWYNNRLSFVTLALRSRYQSDRGGSFQRLVLGGKTGLRGHPTEHSAGNRLHICNLESRFFTGLEILSIKVGAALFWDAGRTWQPDEALTARGYSMSVGGGLRLSLENLLRGEVIRIDGVYASEGRWELSFGTGQYF